MYEIVTLPADSKLKNRTAFFEAVSELLPDPELVKGLEPK